MIAAARDNLTEEQKQLADHLARVDKELRAIEQQRRQLSNQRAAIADSERKLHQHEDGYEEQASLFQHIN